MLFWAGRKQDRTMQQTAGHSASLRASPKGCYCVASPRTGLRPGSTFDVQEPKRTSFQVHHNRNTGPETTGRKIRDPPHWDCPRLCRWGASARAHGITAARDTSHTPMCSELRYHKLAECQYSWTEKLACLAF